MYANLDLNDVCQKQYVCQQLDPRNTKGGPLMACLQGIGLGVTCLVCTAGLPISHKLLYSKHRTIQARSYQLRTKIHVEGDIYDDSDFKRIQVYTGVCSLVFIGGWRYLFKNIFIQ